MMYVIHYNSCRTCFIILVVFYFFFFFNDTATTEIYTLSLHDALPICFLVVFNRPINILCRVSLFLSMALCLLLRLNKETRHRMFIEIGRAVQQECRDRARMPSSA